MQELLSNQWFNYTVLLLNAIVAGQILWIAINIKASKLLQYTIFHPRYELCNSNWWNFQSSRLYIKS
jgi:hypothetical protein